MLGHDNMARDDSTSEERKRMLILDPKAERSSRVGQALLDEGFLDYWRSLPLGAAISQRAARHLEQASQ
jgi:hypothetical protein